MGEHGRLDYAFNNGGSERRSAPVAKMTEDSWRKTIDGFLTSVFLCMSAEIPAMKRSSTGVIVNNASVDGLRGYPFPGGAAYSAAKHGVIDLIRSAALEHAVHGPRICAICPGWIDTPPVAGWMKRNKEVAQAIIKQTPRGTIDEADEIAAAVLWLCCDAASFAIGTSWPSMAVTWREPLQGASGARAWRNGALSICIRPLNGRYNSRMRKIAPEADSAISAMAAKAVGLSGENRQKLANRM
jgi:NAD(P)-dependent dehydrogenase (short-subunit alcohol dehydrogenase family)